MKPCHVCNPSRHFTFLFTIHVIFNNHLREYTSYYKKPNDILVQWPHMCFLNLQKKWCCHTSYSCHWYSLPYRHPWNHSCWPLKFVQVTNLMVLFHHFQNYLKYEVIRLRDKFSPLHQSISIELLHIWISRVLICIWRCSDSLRLVTVIFQCTQAYLVISLIESCLFVIVPPWQSKILRDKS